MGYAHAGVSLKGGVNEVVRFTMQESAAIVTGIRPHKNSIRWRVKEGPARKNHHRGLSEPVCVRASIQMTRDVKARFRLSCKFKTEGLLRFTGRKHELPREGTGPVEILFVGTERPAAPEKLPEKLAAPYESPKCLSVPTGSSTGDSAARPGSGTDCEPVEPDSESPQASSGSDSVGHQATSERRSTQRLVHRDATVYCCAFIVLSTFIYFTHLPLVLFLSRALIFAN